MADETTIALPTYKVKFEGDKKKLKHVPADKTGKAVATYSNGDSYSGHFANQLKNGQGTYTWNLKPQNGEEEAEDDEESASKQQYTGEYKDGQRNGTGMMQYPDGSTYSGEWQDGSRHGAGSYTYANGDKYIGSYANDQKNGQGQLIYANDGTILAGEWVQGSCPNGRWLYYDANQTFEAAIVNGQVQPYVKAQ